MRLMVVEAACCRRALLRVVSEDRRQARIRSDERCTGTRSDEGEARGSREGDVSVWRGEVKSSARGRGQWSPPEADQAARRLPTVGGVGGWVVKRDERWWKADGLMFGIGRGSGDDAENARSSMCLLGCSCCSHCW